MMPDHSPTVWAHLKGLQLNYRQWHILHVYFSLLLSNDVGNSGCVKETGHLMNVTRQRVSFLLVRYRNLPKQ